MPEQKTIYVGGRKKKRIYKHKVCRGTAAKFGVARGYCGKLLYTSKSQAKSALRRTTGASKEYEKEGMTLNSYYCERCEGWHLGHTTI